MTATMANSGAPASAPIPAARPRVGFIVGPTGVGKTTFAIDLAERLGAEIVNADSRQIYRGMDIGTAKPGAVERARVPHHLIDHLEFGQPLDVAAFARLAHQAISDIVSRGKRPLLVGGSGLYLRVVRGGIFRAPAIDLALRAELAAQAAREGSAHLHARLRALDLDAAARIHPNDTKRIVRALEVQETSGIPISRYQREHAFRARELDSLTIGLNLPRSELYERIERRFDDMITAGLVDEVRALLAPGPDPGPLLLSTIGYREIAAYLRGEITLERAVETAKRESRRLAKRQITWFSAECDTVWMDPRSGFEPALRRFEDFFVHGSVIQDA